MKPFVPLFTACFLFGSLFADADPDAIVHLPHPFLGKRSGQVGQIPEKAIAKALLPTREAGQIARSSHPEKSEGEEQFLEEARFVRRIMAFWQDGDTEIVQSQIAQFFAEYPTSSYRDSLLILLGDLNARQKQYEAALKHYEAVSDPSLQQKILTSRLDCLSKLKRHDILIEAALLNLPNLTSLQALTPEEALQVSYCAESLYQKNAFAEAFVLYQKLLGTNHEVNALNALSDIHTAIGNYSQGMETLLALAEKQPEQRDKILLRTALIAAKTDVPLAISLYCILQKGPLKPEATLAKALLLYDLGRFRELIEEINDLHEPQSTLLDFYIGRAFFNLERYEEAIATLLPLLEKHDDTLDKALFLTLIASSCHLGKANQAANLSERFEKAFPSDPALPGILHSLAMLFKNQSKNLESTAILDRLIKEFPNYDKRKNIERERNLLVANRSLQQIEEAEKGGMCCDAVREQLVQDIRTILDSPETLSDEERSIYILKLSKALYDLKRYQDALPVLLNFVTEFSNDPFLFQGHLLLAVCYQEGLGDNEQFVHHAEKVLALRPHIKEKRQLCLNLFSAYLQLAEDSDEESRKCLLDKAADHLYQAGNPLKLENRLWLANHYYEKALSKETPHEPLTFNPEETIYAERALETFRDALRDDPSMTMERDWLRMCILYGALNQHHEAILRLNHLASKSGKMRTQALFYLAQAYEVEGETALAQEAYHKMMESKDDAFLAHVAKLHWARLAFEQMPKEQRSLDNAEMMGILKALKELQMRRQLQYEPVHIEAAIDYARIRSSLLPPGERDAQQRQLLLRAKEEFTSQEGLWAKDYQASLEDYPEQAIVYQAYLLLMDAMRLNVEAKIAKQRGQPMESQVKREAASAIYKSLLQGKFAVSKYLVDQAKSGYESAF